MPTQPIRRDKPRSPYEGLRIEGAIRTAIIGYGVAGLTVLLSRTDVGDPGATLPRQLLYMLLSGLALQAILFAVRTLADRYERVAGLDGHGSPLVVYVFELVVDAITVFLFAWATYRGLLAYGGSI